MTPEPRCMKLRSRIAAAIYGELREQSERDTAFPAMVGPAVGSSDFNGVALIDGEVDLDAAADAVIHKLGRYEYAVATADMEFVYLYADERSELEGLKLHPGEQIVRRHVTEWEPDNG